MDTYTLGDIKDAYHKAEHIMDGEYDVVENNCATFALSMAQNLDYEIDRAVLDFVVEKLAESKIPSFVKKKTSAGALRANGNDYDAFNHMDRLVKQYVKNFLAKN